MTRCSVVAGPHVDSALQLLPLAGKSWHNIEYG